MDLRRSLETGEVQAATDDIRHNGLAGRSAMSRGSYDRRGAWRSISQGSCTTCIPRHLCGLAS
eukprot:6466341-Lingulodinium_polyedra.AAC.1